MLTKPITLNGKYKSKSGHDARILAIDVKSKHPVVAALSYPVKKDGINCVEEVVFVYDQNGITYSSQYDLVEYDPLENFRNMPVNTVVWVKLSTGVYKPRHFKCIGSGGEIVVFANGKTSYTVEGNNENAFFVYQDVFLENPKKA